MGDLAAERRRLDPGRKDGRRALLLRPEAQDVVAGEDVKRPAGRVVADADLVVKVRPGRTSAQANVADGVTTMYLLAHCYSKIRQVPIPCAG